MENTFSTNCRKCGRVICEGEMLNISGKYVCEKCAHTYIFERGDMPVKRRRVPSALLHFVFSFHPGAGHMYLGLMKKGLFQMCMFYFSVYLTTFMPRLFGFVIPIICIYSFFDSLALRRRLVNGEELSDNLYSEKTFFNNNLGLIAIVILVMLVISAIGGAAGLVRDASIRRNRHVIEMPVENGHAVAAVYMGAGHKDMSDIIKPILLTGLGGLIVYNVMKNRKNCDRHGEDER